MTSCSDDDDDPAPQPNLTLTANGNSEEAVAGDTVQFRVDVNHENDLESFTVSSDPVTEADTSISGIGSAGFSYDFMYVIPSRFGANTEITFTFNVTDENGESASQEYNVTVTESGEELNEDQATLLGAQSANEGSLYSTAELQKYQLDGFDAEANDAKIDFVYYYGSNNNASIAAPSDGTVAGNDNAVYDVVAEWANRNATNFLDIEGDYSNIERSTDLEQYEEGLNASESTLANQLSQGDLYAFMTEDGRMGIFQVVTIDGEQSGSITINVKVESN